MANTIGSTEDLKHAKLWTKSKSIFFLFPFHCFDVEESLSHPIIRTGPEYPNIQIFGRDGGILGLSQETALSFFLSFIERESQ